MQHDDDTIIKEDKHFLDLIESGSVQLKSKAIISGTTEIIKDMERIRKKDPERLKNLVTIILSRAYWNRGLCYFDEGNPQQALDDFVQVDKLNPGNKDVKANIKLCKNEMREKGVETFFTKTPSPEVSSPAPQRIEPNGSDQKRESPQGEYVKIGRKDSAFYKHEEKQRPQSSAHHHDSQYLNQPGGKTGKSK